MTQIHRFSQQNYFQITFQLLLLLIVFLIVNPAVIRATESIENNVEESSYVTSIDASSEASTLSYLPRESFIRPNVQSSASGCFGAYIQRSNEIDRNYSKNYNQCIRWALETRRAIDEKMLGKKLSITHASQTICKRYSDCNRLSNALATFDCHSKIVCIPPNFPLTAPSFNSRSTSFF